MLRRERNVRALTVILLLASMLLLYASPRRTRAQEQEPPTPPLKRMRRVRNQPPKSQTPSPQTTQTKPTSQDDVVHVDTDLANILLTAIDKDKRFVTTIRKEDVRVLEDNKPQEITDFE